MLSIGNLTAPPGQKVSGSVQVGSGIGRTLSSNATSIPITLVNGASDGPTLLVLAGIHGSEYVPIATTQRLASTLDPMSLKGAVILVHIANLPAYLGRTVYTSPTDGKNLNRVFPGRPDGTLTERIADFLVEQVYPNADYVMDMHSGDANEQLSPSYAAYYGRAGSSDVIRASREMAYAFGTRLVVEFQWQLKAEGEDRAIWAGSAAVARGIPSIDVEVAPGMGLLPASSVDEVQQGVLRVMDHLGNFKSEIQVGNKKGGPCLVTERHFIESPVEGSWVPLVDTGTFVTKDAPLGYVTDFSGRRRIFEAKAPGDGLLLIRFEAPPVLEGDTVAVVAVLNRSDPACEALRREGLGGARAPKSSNLLLWQGVAVAGWLVALGTFVGMRRRRRKSYPYRRARVSVGEGRALETEDV